MNVGSMPARACLVALGCWLDPPWPKMLYSVCGRGWQLFENQLFFCGMNLVSQSLELRFTTSQWVK